MPDRSEEESLEAELGLDDESSSSEDVDLDALEAELGLDDSSAAAEDGTDDVGLDRDPSEEYADLLGDAPSADGSSTADRSSSGRGDVTGDADDVVDADGSPTDTATADASATANGGLRARLGALFSPRWFLATAISIVVLAGLGRTFVPIVGGPAGLAGGALLAGFASSEGRYLEIAVAGALVGAVGAFAGGVSLAFAAGATTRLLAVGGVGGLVLSLLGAYFGNDLRAALFGGDEWTESEP